MLVINDKNDFTDCCCCGKEVVVKEHNELQGSDIFFKEKEYVCKNCRVIDKDNILMQIDSALGWQFSIYSWGDMIKDSGLNPVEQIWANENTTCKAVDVNEE